ncbi:MAG: hypothetical protein JWN86_864 [Planctomycetota bacterium]|nr:hypothetical protein [Planctomycetota bacterium]
MVMAILRTILVVLATAAFATACFLYQGRPIAGGVPHKETMAFRVLLFGLAAIIMTIWYYLFDFSKRKKARSANRKD